MRYALSFFILALAFACQPTENDKILSGIDLELAKYRKANINTINYALDLRIPEESVQEIQGYEILTFNLLAVERDLQLDFNAPTDHLKAIVVNARSHEIDHRNEHIIIQKEFLQKGFNRIEINFFVGEGSLNRQKEYLYTLFVPDRARTAFPLFDQPNLKATYDLELNIPARWEAIANAPVESLSIKDGRKDIKFRTSDLISSYLFSFVAGDFETITGEVDGRVMTMLHRETDKEKVNRNRDEIFRLHAAALRWMEGYTGIKYPFQKFDFALIPGFQYGGMEHVGAIQYRANSLMLEEDPSQNQLLSRASLIAHETAHMWFGDLVTMDWFDDVWTKEVYANFMAAKMVNPSFPEIDHELSFLLRHYPSAYSVDRTKGANAIRQKLQNLNEAGQMYGPIIYNKAPIMMRQLEFVLGEDAFRSGLQEYLSTYANKNATWPQLIEILDERTAVDLKSWSAVWVNEPGRPHFSWEVNASGIAELSQFDPSGDKVWPQLMGMKIFNQNQVKEFQLASTDQAFGTNLLKDWQEAPVLFNSDGKGYGLYPVDYKLFSQQWESMSDLEKGVQLINAYENLLEVEQVGKTGQYDPQRYLETLKWIMMREDNQLLIGQVLRQTQTIFWQLLSDEERDQAAPDLERTLLHCMNTIHDDMAIKKSYFNAFRNITITENNLNRLYKIWKGEESLAGIKLSENEKISLSAQLAIKLPREADKIIESQLRQIENPDSKRRYEFLKDALSPNAQVRQAKFDSFKALENRAVESWVLTALGYLHHPLRVSTSTEFIRPSLELLQEIQVTGDIFFPKRWLDENLGNHHSDEALRIIDEFLDENPNYNEQLKMKIQQSMDFSRRVNGLKIAWAKNKPSEERLSLTF